MENKEISSFVKLLKTDQDKSAALIAIEMMLSYLKNNEANTLSELLKNLDQVISQMTESTTSSISVISGCELFRRYITLASEQLEQPEWKKCKQVMISRGEKFLQKLLGYKQKVANFAKSFIHDGAKILTHSKSRVVLHALMQAAEDNKNFIVFITESQPNKSGYEMMEALSHYAISCRIILDSAVAHIMERIDICLVGAEGVVESGGIINKIGTYSMALCAKALGKPFYVLAESFKFVRSYPLNQEELSRLFKNPDYFMSVKSDSHPLVDYTPPALITLLFTDLGILTPSAVSDSLIQLYL